MKTILKNIVTAGFYTNTSTSRLLSVLFIWVWSFFAGRLWFSEPSVKWPSYILGVVLVHAVLFVIRMNREAKLLNDSRAMYSATKELQRALDLEDK